MKWHGHKLVKEKEREREKEVVSEFRDGRRWAEVGCGCTDSSVHVQSKG